MVDLTFPGSSLTGPADAEAATQAANSDRISASARALRWAVPGVPALVALLVVLQGLDRRQLWRDEIATWATSTKSLSDLRELVGGTDVVIAPYYLLMHGWIALFGDSEVALRAPSVLAVALAAALTAVIGRRLFEPVTGLLAGVLVAVLPAMSRYGQEARPYALATAATVLATLLLLGAAERPSWARWLPYAVVVTVAGFLHLVTLLILLAHLGYVLSLRRAATTVRWFLAATVGVLPILPLVVIGRSQAGQVSWIPEATWDSTINQVARVAGSVPVGAVLIGLALLGCWTLGRNGGLLGVWAVAPFAVLLLISPLVALLLHRYVLFTIPAWCLLAVATVARHVQAISTVTAPAWRRHVIPAMLVVLCAALGLPAQAENRTAVLASEPDLRGAVGVIVTEIGAGDRIAFHTRYPTRLRDGVNYYFHRAGRQSPPSVFTAWPGAAPSYPASCRDATGCFASAERLWLIGGPAGVDQGERMDPSLQKALNARFELVRVVKLSGTSVSLLRSTV
ncbi:glycosyltransferase family 39 protein [Micromonospora sp. CB01531]|uniref:glycosyltransferase family 39 protein n=1 Tax=Micromonospora sp. CB01531 TaxID=1718947 RepID=UPI00093AB56A|nr:glycosyltransferase family 39 protein [Micromonospora sp. CB01531]OKI89250.1 hypothetical protein A6A27_00720 [Micromonospora sp. CB01531]